MKNIKKILAFTVLCVGMLFGSALAADYESPIEILAKITGKSESEIERLVWSERKSYAQIADESGKWEEYRSATKQERDNRIDRMVKEGRISSDRAAFMKERSSGMMGMGRGCCNGGGRGGWGYGSSDDDNRGNRRSHMGW